MLAWGAGVALLGVLLQVFPPPAIQPVLLAYAQAPWGTSGTLQQAGLLAYVFVTYWPAAVAGGLGLLLAIVWAKAAPSAEMHAYVEQIYLLETALKQAREAAESSTQALDTLNGKLDELFARTAEIWLVISPVSGVRRFNPAALQFAQRRQPALQTLEGRALSDILAHEGLQKAVTQAVTQRAVWQGELQLAGQRQEAQQWFVAWVLPWGAEVAILLREVSHQHRPEGFLEHTELLLRQLVEQSIRPVAVLDTHWRYQYVAQNWAETLGLPAQNLVGEDHWVRCPDFPTNKANLVQQLAAGQRVGQQEERRTVQGREMLISWSIRPWQNALGALGGYIFGVQDVTDQVRLKHQVQQAQDRENQLAYLDALTGLPNRQLFQDRLNVALAQAYRNLSKLAVMFLDLDGFKAVNDKFGHEAGDLLLKQVAARLQACVRAADTLARLGGDEFTLILTIREPRDAQVVAEKILKAVCQPYDLNGQVADTVGTSIGIAIYPQHGTQALDLLKAADGAMYEAKQAGKNTFRFAATSTPPLG